MECVSSPDFGVSISVGECLWGNFLLELSKPSERPIWPSEAPGFLAWRLYTVAGDLLGISGFLFAVNHWEPQTGGCLGVGSPVPLLGDQCSGLLRAKTELFPSCSWMEAVELAAKGRCSRAPWTSVPSHEGYSTLLFLSWF